MKYMIAHLVKGEAGECQKDLAGKLSTEFGVSNVNDRIMPHITLKAPFVTFEKIDALEKIVEDLVASEKSAAYKIKDFGYFGDRVIFMDTLPSAEMLRLIDKLKMGLSKLSWVKMTEQDVKQKLHVTVATWDISPKFLDIWKYLTQFHPEYDLVMDNIAILQWTGRQWEIYREFSLAS